MSEGHAEYPTTITDETAVEHVDWWVTGRRSTSEYRHLPRPGSTRADPRALCGCGFRSGGQSRDIGGWGLSGLALCSQCLQIAQGEADPRRQTADDDEVRFDKGPTEVLREAGFVEAADRLDGGEA